MDLFAKTINDINKENRQLALKRKIIALLNRSDEALTNN